MPARDVQPAAVAPGLRDGAVRPVVGAAPQLPEPARVVDRRVLVDAAGLDHAHARPRVDQTAGDDGTAAARADHDHVERIRHRPILRRGNQLLPDDILLGCMGASGTAHDVEHDQREVRPESGPDDRRDHGEEPGAGLIAEPGTDERAGQ